MVDSEVDLRSKLDSALDAIEDDFIRQFVADIFSMTHLKWAEFEMVCPGCDKKIRKRVQVEKPDYKGVAAALALLADQGKGKPKEAPPPDPKVQDERMRELIREEIKAAIADIA